MVTLSKPAIQRLPFATFSPCIPSIDLARPDSESQLIRACEQLGFFKVVNHQIPIQLIQQLESEALGFFTLAPSHKSRAGPPDPLGYGDKWIGPNGDSGWVEFLLLTANNTHSDSRKIAAVYDEESAERFLGAVNEYVSAVKKLTCEILEMLAVGLKIQPKDVFSKLLMDAESDSIFRLNHYPPFPGGSDGGDLIGFGEHTDPQIISVLRSNDASGLQILNHGGDWISVPPDQNSFFVNVGDSLQVMTNGRFKSVRHRVMANSRKSRVSMIYFGGPPLGAKIGPLMKGEGEDSLYRDFTWFEYKKSAYKTRLGEDRLVLFQRIAAT